MRFGLAATALLLTMWPAGQAPAPASGIDRSGFDTSVRPQDDLFEYVNGRWLQSAVIPDDRVSYGTFTELSDRVELDLNTIIGAIAARGRARNGTAAQQIADLYASMLDEDRIESLGAAPLRPVLERIDRIRGVGDMAEVAGYLSSIAAGGPFAGNVAAHPRDPAEFVIEISQGGTLLPDRDYYTAPGERFVAIRDDYVRFLERIFTLTGRARAYDDARAVLALETTLARAYRMPADDGPTDAPRAFAVEQLDIEMPGFDWMRWGRPQGITPSTAVVLRQPVFFKRFASLVPATPLETWKAWLAARYITAATPYVSRAFNEARFEFFGRILTGQEAPRARWKRGVSIVSVYLGHALGREYVAHQFPRAAKDRAEKIVENLRTAMRAAIDNATWLSPSSKRHAVAKLARLRMKVGYPDHWRDYRGLQIRRDDLLGNIQRAQQFENRWRMSHITHRGGDDHWLMTPQTLNAYYAPGLNEIVVPAAMLQPPLFDATADDAVNYGAIGAVIGHELAHGFDSSGRLYDARGEPRDWWTPDDAAAFAGRVLPLVAHYNAFTAAPGIPVNGELTLGENVGDLSGLAIAYRAYRLSRDGPALTIEGLTGDQRFFIAWARVWRGKERAEHLRQTLHTTRHAPWRFRANGPLAHLDAFHDAFGVKPGDALYREPDKRVRLW